MNKKTQMIVGVGVVAIAGYLLWKKSQTKPFANAVGRTTMGKLAPGGLGSLDMALIEVPNCTKGYSDKIGEWYICCDPHYKSKSATQVECGRTGTGTQGF